MDEESRRRKSGLMLHRLLQLANDPSAESRRRLLFAVTDLFLANGTDSPDAIENFSEIVGTVIEAVRDEHRAAYAERVAPEERLPAGIAGKLARDPDVAVATVIVRFSPVLSDDDLVAIAGTHGPDHVLAIAERAILTPKVTDALIASGNDTAIRRVSVNEGAQFSNRGLSDLLTRGKADPALLANLSKRRSGLPKEQAKRIQSVMGELQSGRNRTSAPGSPRRGSQTRRPDVANLLEDIRNGSRCLDEVAVRLTDEDRAFDLARIIGTIAGVPDAQVLKVLLEPDVADIAAACGSVGLSPDGFRAILKLRAARLNLQQRQIEREAKVFEDLAREVSEPAMRFLKAGAKAE